jgi:hypothetical protein
MRIYSVLTSFSLKSERADKQAFDEKPHDMMSIADGERSAHRPIEHRSIR